MKKTLSLFLITLFLSTITKSQGIYRLWGMTQAGGADNNGAIFSADYAGNHFTPRFQFDHIQNAGAYPQGSELAAYNGKFYGMTSQGGEANMGVLFEWDPATNVYTRKVDFIGSNGGFPHGSLTLLNGKLYGLAQSGGAFDKGILFEFDPATGNLVKKIDFNDGYNGAYPLGNLSFANGKLYGTTRGGGFYFNGCIFEYDPATNILVDKVDLDYAGGFRPYGNSLALNPNGKFYGMMTSGGSSGQGCIFEWDPVTNTYLKKIDFNGTNGGTASGNLFLYNNKYYGMTRFGGTGNHGVIFEWDPTLNQYNIKISFDGSNGSEPTGSLNFYNGKFYGLAHDGGTDGTLFEWDPVANTCTADVTLNSTTGVAPYGSLLLSGGKFYGMLSNGGNNFKGTIFEFNPAGNVFTKKIDLNGGTSSKNPRGTLTQVGDHFLGVASRGGLTDAGVIFEWNPAYPGYTKKIDCTVSAGSNPYSSLVLHNNRYFGTTSQGGDYFSGTLFYYHPDSVSFVKRIDFNGTNGRKPIGDLTFIGEKAYGITSEGGNNNFGVIYEWDVSTNTLTKKFDFDTQNGSVPTGKLVLYNNKLYGMTQFYCSSNAGCIFEWDPNTNIFTKKFDFNNFVGSSPTGSLAMYNGKFYGLTANGGTFFGGAIFEWDPATNDFNTKINLSPAMGTQPNGSLTLSGDKFYGVTNTGGANNRGVMFEWDPVTNAYTVKKDFTGTDAGNPSYGNDLAKYPAPVASGVANSCTSFPAITIDNSNNNVWVPIVDNNGDAIAEIKANGNNLGVVNTSMYINSGPVREDAAHRLYLDRNLTITPAVQPSTPVNVRLYLKGSEYEALKNALNSQGQPSGINSINDIGFFKNSEGCVAALQNSASPVVVTGEAWNNDYVITATISGFSSFYAANKVNATLLSLSFLDFTARMQNKNALLNWSTGNEINTRSFDVQRSTDGNHFTDIGAVNAYNTAGQHHYNFTDDQVSLLKVSKVFYRIKQKDNDGRYTYSAIVPLLVSGVKDVLIYPNPAGETITVQISDAALIHSMATICDVQGREVKKYIINNNTQPLDISGLPSGMYILRLADGGVGKFYKR